MVKRAKSFWSAALVAGLAVGGVTSLSHGAIIVSVVDLGHPQVASGTTAAQSNAFEAYDIRLTTNDGGTVSAVDIGSITGRGIFSTSFLQRAALGTDPDSGDPTRTLTPQSTANNSTVTVNDFDTHLIPASTARIDTVSPNEDNDGVNSANAPADSASSDYGNGTFLRGVFGILLASQSANTELAYVVMPVGTTATILGTAAENGGTLNGVSQAIAGTIGAAAVPEPASIALLGLGALGVLSRKRRA